MSKCISSIENAKGFINLIIADYLNSSPYGKNSKEYDDDIKFSEYVKSLILKEYTINNKTYQTVFNKLSCSDFCSFNSKGSYDVKQKKCICENGTIPTEKTTQQGFLYSTCDNTSKFNDIFTEITNIINNAHQTINIKIN